MGRDSRHDLQIIFDLLATASALANVGRDEEAVEVEASAQAPAEEVAGPDTAHHLFFTSVLDPVRSRLGPAQMAQAEARGRALPPEQCVTRACQLAASVIDSPVAAG